MHGVNPILLDRHRPAILAQAKRGESGTSARNFSSQPQLAAKADAAGDSSAPATPAQ
jgi:hypothetical protein